MNYRTVILKHDETCRRCGLPMASGAKAFREFTPGSYPVNYVGFAHPSDCERFVPAPPPVVQPDPAWMRELSAHCARRSA